jgi:RNA polymerase sigma-70 factor (ECF subfamily)
MSSALLPVGKPAAPRAGESDRAALPGPDRDWLVGVAGGDLVAFENLYRHYEKRIYQYVYLLAGNASIAEDVVVETMLAVWRGARRFAHASRVSTWIFGIARHKAFDALRRVARERNNVPVEEAMELADTSESAADQMSRGQEAKLLRAGIAKLSREHQEVLRLVFYEELPYEEIASLLGVPLNTVKTRVYYAKQQLKVRLDGFAQGMVKP